MAIVMYESGFEERVASTPGDKNQGYFLVWLTSFAFLLGLSAFVSEQLNLLPFFLAMGYSAVLFAFVRMVRAWRDIFNPLCLVIMISFVRFFCPGLLLLSGAELPEGVELFFQLMKISETDWQWGHALALMGLLGVVLGWILVPGLGVNGKRLNVQLPNGIKYAALFGMIVGGAAILLFVRGNASLDVIASGEFRGTTIQPGTGKYLYAGYMLMASSVLLSGWILSRGHKWRSLVPVAVAASLYWILGGRARAMTPFVAGLVLAWYVSREKCGWERLAVKRVYTLSAPVSLLCAVWLFYVGDLYRGGSGISAFSEALSLSGLWNYMAASIFMQLGQLHSLAGAIAIGPGVLGGYTFIGSLLWPLEKFLPIPGRSAGVFIVETLMGFADDRRWGLNASLVGDAYLNFGVAGVAIVMVLFGMALKLLYVRFREGILQSAIYALALIHGLQIYWSSIEVWPQTLTVLAFTVFIFLLGKTVFKLNEAVRLH